MILLPPDVCCNLYLWQAHLRWRLQLVLLRQALAPGSAEALTVVHAEAEAGRHLVQAGYMRRFDPPYAEMKGALDAGLIGRAVMMHNFHRNVVAPPHFTGVMAITNSAPHEFDIARYVLGAELTSISAYQPANVDASQPGAPVVMVITTDAGQLVTVEVNVNATYGYHVRGELVGETGSLGGPSLYFELRRGGDPVDPEPWLMDPRG